MKTLNVTNEQDGKNKVSDIETHGNTDLWVLICKASSKSQGWMKSTKAMRAGNGCIVQVTTQQGDNISESICFVPNTYIDTKDRKPRLMSY